MFIGWKDSLTYWSSSKENREGGRETLVVDTFKY
jgi:hypothetical protein